MRITAQTPAWLPSHASGSPSLVSPTAKAVSQLRETEALRAGVTAAGPRKASKSKAFQAFCGSLGKPALTESHPSPAGTGTGAPALSSSWSAPPLAKGPLRDPVLDGSGGAAASPRWDGWSHKRQGRASQSQAAIDEARAEALAQDLQRSAVLADGAGGLGDAEGLGGADSHSSGSEDDDNDDDDDDIFLMEADVSADGSLGTLPAAASADPAEPYANIVDKNLKQLQGKHAASMLRERTGSF